MRSPNLYVDPPLILLPNAVADAGLGIHSQEGSLFRKNFNKLHEIEKKIWSGGGDPSHDHPEKRSDVGTFHNGPIECTNLYTKRQRAAAFMGCENV